MSSRLIEGPKKLDRVMVSAPVAPQSDIFMCMQLAGKYAMSVKGTKQKFKRIAVAVVIEEGKEYL